VIKSLNVYRAPNQKKVKIIDFNVWGRQDASDTVRLARVRDHRSENKLPEATLAGTRMTLNFASLKSQGNILPGLQLGVPYDLYDMSEGGAISEFLEEQRKRQESEH
jgi:D123.